MVGCYPSPAPVLARTEVNARSHEHTPEQNVCSLITSLFVNLLTQIGLLSLVPGFSHCEN